VGYKGGTGGRGGIPDNKKGGDFEHLPSTLMFPPKMGKRRRKKNWEGKPLRKKDGGSAEKDSSSAVYLSQLDPLDFGENSGHPRRKR